MGLAAEVLQARALSRSVGREEPPRGDSLLHRPAGGRGQDAGGGDSPQVSQRLEVGQTAGVCSGAMNLALQAADQKPWGSARSVQRCCRSAKASC